MNDLQIFNNSVFGSIRTITIDGEPWFVGKDIAEALGYVNTKKALADHVDVEDKRGSQIVTPGGIQTMTIINESGLYSLILSSKLPNAKMFKRWVTSEILPAIRKSGHYDAPGYTPKATSIGEVVNLIKIARQTMKEQGAVAQQIKVPVSRTKTSN